MKSRVHPTYKTKYHVQNWAAYDRALVRRGDITIWVSPAAIAAWEPEGPSTRGAQRKYSDLAIQTALTLRLLFHLPLRQAEGFLASLFVLMGLDLRSPDHTTLSRRGQHLDCTLRRVPTRAGLHLIIDSTGLSIVGQGEWAAAKYGHRGTRRRRADRGRPRRHRESHRGRSLRHGRLLPSGRGTGRDRRGSAGQDGQSVPTQAAVERSRSHDQEGEADRPAPVEGDVTLPSASAS